MTIVHFQPVPALAGGILIGLAASGLLLFNGRITGISGICGEVLTSAKDRLWRVMFLCGLIFAGFICRLFYPDFMVDVIETGYPMIVAAGLLVGFGTRLGSGCTSGHGVCGVGRCSVRSIAATAIFMLSGMIVVWIVRVLGG